MSMSIKNRNASVAAAEPSLAVIMNTIPSGMIQLGRGAAQETNRDQS
jgi:hypothetical protein